MINKVSGAIFICDKKHAKSPDFLGKINLDQELLLDLLEQMNETGISVLSIACWKSVSAQNNSYLKVEATKYIDFKAKKRKWKNAGSGSSLFN